MPGQQNTDCVIYHMKPSCIDDKLFASRLFELLFYMDPKASKYFTIIIEIFFNLSLYIFIKNITIWHIAHVL